MSGRGSTTPMEASPIGTRGFPATINLPSDAEVRRLLGSGAGQLAKRAPMPQCLAFGSVRFVEAREVEMRVGKIGIGGERRPITFDGLFRLAQVFLQNRQVEQ